MWRRARETDGAGSAVLHDEDVQSSNDEAGRSVSDALQQLKHNHANLMREKKQIEQYAADIEHDVRHTRICRARASPVSWRVWPRGWSPNRRGWIVIVD